MLSNKVRGRSTEVGIYVILVRFGGLFERLKGAFWGQNLSKNFSFEKIGFDPKKPTLDIPPNVMCFSSHIDLTTTEIVAIELMGSMHCTRSLAAIICQIYAYAPYNIILPTYM